jgi:hypothetical protein
LIKRSDTPQGELVLKASKLLAEASEQLKEGSPFVSAIIRYSRLILASFFLQTDAHNSSWLRTNGEVWENCLDVGYPDFRHQGAAFHRRPVQTLIL